MFLENFVQHVLIMFIPLISSLVHPSPTYQTLCPLFSFFHSPSPICAVPIFLDIWSSSWPVADLLGATLSEKTNFPLLPVANISSARAGLHAQLLPSVLWLVLSWDCRGLVHNCGVCTRAATLLCPEDTCFIVVVCHLWLTHTFCPLCERGGSH